MLRFVTKVAMPMRWWSGSSSVRKMASPSELNGDSRGRPSQVSPCNARSVTEYLFFCGSFRISNWSLATPCWFGRKT